MAHQLGSVDIPLRQWIQAEAARGEQVERNNNDWDEIKLAKKQSLLRKLTVAYGIVELLKRADNYITESDVQSEKTEICNLDNFVVHTSSSNEAAPWNDVAGVSMISPALSAQVFEPWFLTDENDENNVCRLGRYIEADITPPLPHGADELGARRSSGCYSFGILLYELCCGNPPEGKSPPSNDNTGMEDRGWQEEPKAKRKSMACEEEKDESSTTSSIPSHSFATLQDLGYPPAISTMTELLICCHEAYSSLEDVGKDIHLLLKDPNCFLFGLDESAAKGGGSVLQIKAGKLYGRGKEATLITDAFCRVSSGSKEAFFIGGYSGSGKTVLVNSLRARVDISGGYVLTQKLDEQSKERPLLDVLSAFNHLCILVKERNTPQKLLEIFNRIMHDFESDFPILNRLLPNLTIVFPGLANMMKADSNVEQMMTLHNVCFTLQRFMRIVSSRLKPVMLFLDDLQWGGKSSFDLIYSLLTDTRGSSCFFFVGSYRDNEVEGHPVLDMIAELNVAGVKNSNITLTGLDGEALNEMISEMLCMLPRLCKSLSDIVLEKTQGNPFFALSFLRSLVDSRLLKFSLRERKWIWDESKIRSEKIADNVLYLLTNKMTSLPENVQLALKVVSCFGIRIDDRIVDSLSSIQQYSDLKTWLDQAETEGCLQKVEEDYKFVHDKVREASYSLIPDDIKRQVHYDLGILLYSVLRDQNMTPVIFQVVNQINHGIHSLIPADMRVEISELNTTAGSRAVELADFETAHTYLTMAISLLPNNHWTALYKFSLRLYFLAAKSAYSVGKRKRACILLKDILERGKSTKDKLDAYSYYITILHASQNGYEAYTTCREVLSHLNESVPESIKPLQAASLLIQTSKVLNNMSDEDLMNMQQNDGTGVSHFTQKFYMLMGYIAFWHNPSLMPFLACRHIELSLKHGIDKYAAYGFIQYSAIMCQQTQLIDDIKDACRIGKIAMTLLEQFDSSELYSRTTFGYFGFVAVHTEPLQTCTSNLRKGFEVGLSAGEPEVAFYNSIHLFRIAILSGENLPTLLKELDYHLDMMTKFSNSISLPYLTAYRETISILIDKGKSSQDHEDAEKLGKEMSSDPVYAQRHEETMSYNRVMQSFYLGYTNRCHHYAKKALGMQLLGRHNKYIILFYSALNAFRGIKNNNGNGSQFLKARPQYNEAIKELRTAAELSPWNFSNKVHLLQAECHSFEKNNEEAASSYAAAISSSRFTNERSLACELAGLHYVKIGQKEVALEFFAKAKECYTQWGSEMKVESITQQIEKITGT